MRVIDSDNYKASGIETFFFPGGEPHARIPENFGDALLFLKPRTWNDVGLAMVVLGALWKQQDGDKGGGHRVWLFCPYFPGARQDRSDYCTPVTKTLMWNLLGRSTHRIYTFDIHSNIPSGLWIERNFMPADLGKQYMTAPENAYIISPDSGAQERAQSLAKAIGLKSAVIQCGKHRDFASGKFTGFTMPPLPGVGDYLIVDDICDGGGTFNLLADEFLKDKYGADSSLTLFVSHGIFSKGLDAIHPKIDQIFTTDSWCQLKDNHRLDVIPLQQVIEKILEEST